MIAVTGCLARRDRDKILSTACVDEVLYGIRTVQAFCHEAVDRRRYGSEVNAARKAAVDRAAASPPAATSPTTQSGRSAISGFARTMMSRSTVSSFVSGESGPTNWMRPSPFAS